jgi:hypothetical protein
MLRDILETKNEFEELWKKIRAHKNETFRTIRGLDFTYNVLGPWLIISRTDLRITKSNFKKAYDMLPVDDPDSFSNEVTAKYYVYSILTDPRIIE